MKAQSGDTGRRGGVAGGVILIQGEFVQALGVFALLLAIPLVVSWSQHIDLPWSLVGPFVLVAAGLAIIVRAVTRT